MNFKDLVGKTLTSIKGKEGDDELLMEDNEGKKYRLYHDRDCCETVEINDITGDLNDLLHHPILLANEESNQDESLFEKADEYRDSFTWTFYRIGTIKGSAVIRWLGESNGYYSESVSFEVREDE